MPDTQVKDKIATLEMLKKVDDHNLEKDFSELESVPSGESIGNDDLVAIKHGDETYKVTRRELAEVMNTTVSSPATANDNPATYEPGVYRLNYNAFNTSYWPVTGLYGVLHIMKTSDDLYKVAHIICSRGGGESREFFGYMNINSDTAFNWTEAIGSAGGWMTGSIVYNTSLDMSNPTTSSQEIASVTDKNGAKMGMIRADTYADGTDVLQIGAVRDVNGERKYALLKCCIDANGSAYYEAPGIPFKTPVTLGKDSYLQKVSTDIDAKANPSAIQYADAVITRDKDNRMLGLVGSTHRTDGTNTLRLVCCGYDTSGNQTGSRGITIYTNRSGVATYALDNKANFRDAIGIKYASVTLDFTASANGSYADYDFGTSVYVLGAALVAARNVHVSGFSRVSGFTKWTFMINSTTAHSNVSVDIFYIVIN